jgi:hypothetical protein
MTTHPASIRFRLTPGLVVLLLLVVEALLFLSNWLAWPAWHKGYAVLTCAAAVGVAMVLLGLWWVVAAVFRWKFQFGIWTLLVLAVAVAAPCSWMGFELKKEREQERVLATIKGLNGETNYDWQVDADGHVRLSPEPPGPELLRQCLGEDFFAEVADVQFVGAGSAPSSNAELVADLKQLRFVRLEKTSVTDTELRSLARLTRLRELSLDGTLATDGGVNGLYDALPTCSIYWLPTSPDNWPYRASAVLTVAEASNQAARMLARLRGNFPGRTEDEIIRVVREFSADKSAEKNGLGWLTERLVRVNRQRAAVKTILKGEGSVDIDYDFDSTGGLIRQRRVRTREWLRSLLGDDFFDDVKAVYPGPGAVAGNDLECLKWLPHLEELGFNRLQITDGSLRHVNCLRQLRTLMIDSDAITCAGLANLKELTQLEKLVLGGQATITDAGMANLAKLRRLEYLWLDGRGITDDGLKHLEGLTQLHELHIGPRLSDAALKHLKGLKQLRQLELICDHITGAGFKHLKGLSQLRELDLIAFKMPGSGETCTAQLDYIKELRQLRKLVFNCIDATPEDVEELRRALPHCDIEHHR